MQNSVTVLIPAYNEEEMLEKTTLELLDYLKSLKRKKVIGSFEIIICINASTDKTEYISRKLSKEYEEIRYFSIKERGMGIALRRGVEKASKNIIVSFIPADGELLNDFIEDVIPILKQYDFICGSRYLIKLQGISSGVRRSILSRGFAFIFRNLFSRKFTEVGTAKIFFRKWGQKVIRKCKRKDASWQVEILYYAMKDNLKIKEIPVTFKVKREKGKSKIRLFREGWSFFKITLMYSILLRIDRIKKFLGLKS